MIRTSLLWMFVGFLAVYAWRDWYKALCGVILMMAVVQHPDMPTAMFGIPGFNPWNIALLCVLVAWASARQREGATWDLPRHITIMVILYLVVMFVASARMMLDRSYLEETVSYLIGEHFINVFKWVLPALLLFDGCRDRKRLTIAVFSVLGVYVLLALQVIRWIPLEFAASGDALEQRSQKIISNEIGYHRVNMSMMLAGASWAIFVSRALLTRASVSLLVLGGSLVVFFGQSLTAGRTGYVTWGSLGLILCLVRWKRYLVVAPVLVAVLMTLAPGVRARLFEGFTEETVDTNSRIEEAAIEQLAFDGGSGPDLYTVTSGRTFAWPFVIEKIQHNIVFGYGKLAMRRTGLHKKLLDEYGEGFPHPHNMYLELMFDSGLIGVLCVLPFYAVVVFYSLSLFRDSRSPVFVALGGMAAALVLATLIAGVGSQTFYPREGAVGMWAAIGLMLRVWVERRRAEAVAATGSSVTVAPTAIQMTPKHKSGRLRLPLTQRAVAQRPAGWAPVPATARMAAGLKSPARRRHVAASNNLDAYLWGSAT